MKHKNIKLAAIIVFCLIFDSTRPFAYFFMPKLTFIALISLALHLKTNLCLFFALIAGAFTDSLIFPNHLFYFFVYPLLVLAVSFLNKFFYTQETKNRLLPIKPFLIAAIVFFYTAISSLGAAEFDFTFFFLFFAQAYFSFFFVDYLLQNYLKPQKKVKSNEN